MTPSSFTRNVVAARAVLALVSIAGLAAGPLPGHAGYALGTSLWALASSAALWPVCRRNPRAAAAVLVVGDTIALTVLHATAGFPGSEVAFVWPMVLSAFLLGPRWPVRTALFGAAAMATGDIMLGNTPFNEDTLLAPVLLLAGIGYVLGRFAALQQRTTRERDELAVHRRSLFDAAPDALVLLDERLEPQRWNAAAERLFGLTAHGRLGGDLPLFTADDDLTNTDDDRRVLDRVRRDGRSVALSTTLSVLRDPGTGRITGYCAGFRDATTLRRRTSQLRRLSELAADMAALSDPDEVIGTFLGSAVELADGDAAGFVQLSGDTCEVVAAVGIPEWLVGYRYPATKGVVAGSIESGSTIVLNDYASDQRAHPIFRELGFTAILDVPIAQAGVRAVLTVGRRSGMPFTEDDVRIVEALAGHAGIALQRAQALQRDLRLRDELERLNRVKDEFLTTVSHELRTPLTALSGFLTTLRERSGQIEDGLRDDLIVRAGLQAERLERQIVRLLDLSRISNGYTPRPRAVDLRAVAALAVATSPVSSTCAVDVDDLTVLADPDDLEMALRNLLENAAKYARGAGVRIEARRSDQRAVVSVSDDGPGIPPAERGRLFERFFRGSDTARIAGMGVGLAIVKDCVERTGGSVRYEPRTPHGSRFVLTLPLAIENTIVLADERPTVS